MRIDPLFTRHPATGAIRPLTPSLLAEIYLVPKAKPLDLASAIRADDPWAASHAAAPRETEAALQAALRAVATGTPEMVPSSLRPEALPDGRAKHHLTGIKQLWERMDGTLPDDLAIWRDVLSSSASDALEALPVVESPTCHFASPAERALEDLLRHQHGTVSHEVQTDGITPRLGMAPFAPGALGEIQAGLSSSEAAVPPDHSVAFWGLRDPAEEAAFAAGMIQKLLDDGIVASPADVAILTPGSIYPALAAAAFATAGLPLSGGEGPAVRDLAADLMVNVLRVLQGPGARMALAAAITSPLMPWSTARGSAMARHLMDRGHIRPDPASAPMLDLLRGPVISVRQLFARLGDIQAALAADFPQARETFAELICRLRAALTLESPDWTLARAVVDTAPSRAPAERFIEGVSLFTADALPWRRCKRLIVLGAAGDAYPTSAATDPVFLDREKLEIRRLTNLWLPTRGEVLARRIELFRRQLCAATETVDVLVPALDSGGKRLSTSTAHALMARCLGITTPAELVTDVSKVPKGSVPSLSRTIPRDEDDGQPALPETGELALGSDLLSLRRTDDGRAKPQSPSRLDTLLVSPLAWTLSELDLHAVPWKPESLDVLTLGSLAHDVLEHAFPANAALPSEAALASSCPDLVADAVARISPWLAQPGWETERGGLVREITAIASAWRRRLEQLGATVLANEISLSGEGYGLMLNGRADCLLQIADGRHVIVDHKRSRSASREKRMQHGWDLQVELYRAMLARPTTAAPVPTFSAIAVAYNCLLDDHVLSNGLADAPGIDDLENDISELAVAELVRLAAKLGAGLVPLGRADDAKRFDKERGMKAYALDDAFVSAFLLPVPDEPSEDAE
ncbi:PD-(D/E)XK nuclease family protein [Tabrizicola sp. J26]|uniref:PD-(D/E)XK nuclease family protein n=1 Tax=Alitabrizicola rongguiensis TaxID=2909234 RepID=UPI001F266FF6|nr:PD-(D/E)XK nuclease family protein [Tabrizicola rongguiensis]MCF1708697.1 PD-(D/E)XK nuclease family protein [Tabrizicola rongguiensis]